MSFKKIPIFCKKLSTQIILLSSRKTDYQSVLFISAHSKIILMGNYSQNDLLAVVVSNNWRILLNTSFNGVPTSVRPYHMYTISGFGGLEVACWPLVPKFPVQTRPKPSDF